MFDIGEIQVKRVEEYLGPGFQPNQLLPDWNREAIEPELRWVAPTYYDAVKDRLISSIHSWVLKTRHHTILIDTCVGNHKHRPEQPRFHMLDRPYMANLAAAGIRPEEVDFVMCTHLHVDHVGWNTRLENGRWVPTFPNAKYVFSKTDRDYFDPTRGEGGKQEKHALVFNDSVLPIIEAKQDLVVDGTQALGDNMVISPAPGHSPGHVVITVKSGGTEAMFVGDVMHHPMQIHQPEWSSAFCSDPAEARRSRRKVLEHAASAGTILYPAHFAGPHIARVGDVGGRFRFLPGRE
jgi:glyoxylase-like metal-dependent hydrolase (beta-lactamase superfamily II)